MPADPCQLPGEKSMLCVMMHAAAMPRNYRSNQVSFDGLSNNGTALNSLQTALYSGAQFTTSEIAPWPSRDPGMVVAWRL